MADYEANVHVCGYHKSVLDADEPPVLTPFEWTCPVCKVNDRHARDLRAADKKLKEPDRGPFVLDGKIRGLRLATLGEVREHQRRTETR